MKGTYYLVQDKTLALADLMFTETLEPSFEQMPEIGECEFLPDTTPRNSVKAAYYKDGGNEWPDRWLIRHSPVKGALNFLKWRKAA